MSHSWLVAPARPASRRPQPWQPGRPASNAYGAAVRLSAEQLSASMRVQRVSVQRPKIVQMEVFRVFRVTRLKHLKHLKPLNRLEQVKYKRWRWWNRPNLCKHGHSHLNALLLVPSYAILKNWKSWKLEQDLLHMMSLPHHKRIRKCNKQSSENMWSMRRLDNAPSEAISHRSIDKTCKNVAQSIEKQRKLKVLLRESRARVQTYNILQHSPRIPRK